MKNNLLFIVLIMIIMISFLFNGCGNTAEKVSEQNPSTVAQNTVAQQKGEQSTSTAADQKSEANSEKTRKIVDMAGRTVEVPTTIKKAYTTSQIGIIVLYTLNPDKLAGWGFELSDVDKQFIDEKYHSLPVLGVWSGKNGSGNIEEIIKVHPDVIFSIGTIEDSQISLSDKIQEQTGIPVVMLDGPLEKLDKMYKEIGDIMNEEARAKELGDYCAKTIADINTFKSKIPDEKKARVYYAEGPKGLETDSKGSFHTEVLDFVGGINVADVPMQGGYGRSAVSLEQLMKWDPEVIIVGYDKDTKGGFYNEVYNTPEWKDIKAVKDKKVYSIPNRPFDWFDRPPSVNRIIGVKWLANLLYPDYVDLDITKEAKDFYEKFYHKKLTDEEVKLLWNP